MKDLVNTVDYFNKKPCHHQWGINSLLIYIIFPNVVGLIKLTFIKHTVKLWFEEDASPGTELTGG